MRLAFDLIESALQHDGLKAFLVKPVNYGDSLKVRLAGKQKTLRGDSGYGEVRWDAEVTNQEDEICTQYDVLTMVATDAHWESVR